MKHPRLVIGQAVSAVLFIWTVQVARAIHWAAWAVPLALVLIIVINSVWPTRFMCWFLFAVSFFCFVAVLSAFTLRFRTEAGFASAPFYRSMLMYIAFIYVSLGQLKVLNDPSFPRKRESSL